VQDLFAQMHDVAAQVRAPVYARERRV